MENFDTLEQVEIMDQFDILKETEFYNWMNDKYSLLDFEIYEIIEELNG